MYNSASVITEISVLYYCEVPGFKKKLGVASSAESGGVMPTAHLSLAQLWQICIQQCTLSTPGLLLKVCDSTCNLQYMTGIGLQKVWGPDRKGKMLQVPLWYNQLSSAMEDFKWKAFTSAILHKTDITADMLLGKGVIFLVSSLIDFFFFCIYFCIFFAGMSS